MAMCQAGSVDMLMYYDARPCSWNGLFDFMQLGKCTTTAYFAYPMFNTLYELGEATKAVSDNNDVYVCSACSGDEAAFFVAYFNNDDANEGTEMSIAISGFSSENGVEASIYLLDNEHELTLTDSIVYFGKKAIINRSLPNFTSYLVKVKKL
jgi:hypothetical protein